MIRLPGILKFTTVIAVDFLTVYAIFSDFAIASAVTAVIALYAAFGGYIALLQDGAIQANKLPAYERDRLFNAKKQLTEDVKRVSSVNISRVKFYLVSGDDDMQGTAYGAHSVSVSQGTLDNVDAMTLNAVVAHELSHALNLDPEFHRAVLATIFLICVAISIMSTAIALVVFLIFILCSAFRSWIGVIFYKGTRKTVGSIFKLVQKMIVILYQAVMSCISRAAEYRCDLYAANLNPSYGIQLANFLSHAAPDIQRQYTLTEALYRSHPPTSKRIARLEKYCGR